MKRIFIGAHVFDADTHTFLRRDVSVQNGRIESVAPSIPDTDAERIDCGGMYLIPGMIDVHTHGRAGYDFTTVPRDKMEAVLLDYAAAGTTTVLPTLASAPFEDWVSAVRKITVFGRETHDGAYVPGIHLEGRYLSHTRRGAHAADLLASPSVEELHALMEAAAPSTVHISLAPELPGSGEFIVEAVRMGATVGIAHTDCSFEDAMDAVARGAVSFTHTFNCMRPLHHRDPGCVGAALLSEDAYAEIICDGLHAHPAMTKLLWRAKSPDRIVLITDSMEATGCGDGRYSIAGLPVIVKDGRAVTIEGALAGSTLTLFDGMVNYMRFAGASLEDAIPLATENPARMTGLYGTVGSITPGKRADMILLDDPADPKICSVVCGGAILHS